MFRTSGIPEPVNREFLELYNPDAAPVDLSGCVFDKGVDYTFPAGATLPAGGYLVVVANKTVFQSLYPAISTGITFGPWAGTLANSGQTVRLVSADRLTTLASVKYGSEGEWATRTRSALDNGQQGWEWVAPAEATGKTLELRNALLETGEGQNWGASVATGGSPGAANSLAVADVAPFILGVKHSPAIPKPTDTVTVEANLVDMPGSTVTGTLYWRISNSSPGAFSATAMSKVGGASSTTYQAVLQAQATSTVIEFYVSASDGTLIRTWPPPNNVGQTTNCLYQVDTETVPTGTAIYRVIMSVPELTQFNSMTTHTDAAMNCTFIGDDGSGPAIRYRADVRYRGASSRDFSPAPNRINVPSDNPYNGSTKMNMNSKYTWLQFIGMKLMNSAGVRSPDTKKVLLRRNGVNPMSSTATENYGFWAHLEPLGGEFIDNHFPDDSDGNLYKKVRPDNDWKYNSGVVATYLSDGWLKESNSAANDWSQLDNFLRVMNQAQGAPDYLEQVQEVADLDQWTKWFAVETILTNGETNASNGADDDYSLYFSGHNQKAEFVPHDFDTILGQGDSSKITDPNRTLFDMSENGDILNPLVSLFGTASGGGNATFRTQYFTRLRELCLTSFSQPRFDALVDNQLTGWVPASKIAELKTFMNSRRSYILTQCAAALGSATPAPPAATYTSAVTAPVKAVQLNEVLAKNVTGLNVGGVFPDYVELHNTTAGDITLDGMRLTSAPTNDGGLEFPEGTILPAGGYLLVYGGDGVPGAYNLGFSLDEDGGSLRLFAAVASGGALLDSIAYGPQLPDKSISRATDGDTWTLCDPSPNQINGAALALGDPNGIRLNEWFARPANRADRDFLELYNPAVLPVPLGGLRMTDDVINRPTAMIFPPLSFMSAQGFYVLHAVGSSATPQNYSELPFSIAGDQDWATLSGINGVVVDQINILCQVPDISQGRSPDGALATQFFTLPTPGIANATTTKISSDASYANAVKLMNNIRVTELMYNPGGTVASQAEEFVEIRNIGTETLNLEGLRFKQGITFTFPSYNLAAGAYALVVADLAAFTAKYGAALPVVGAASTKLSNAGERVELQLPAPFNADVQSFTYKDSWYPDTDGAGHSLVLVNQSGPLSAWDQKSGWASSPDVGGTPGTAGPPQITSSLTASGTVNVLFSYQVAAANEPTSFSATGLPDGITINPTTGLISGIATIDGVTTASISATNLTGTDTKSLVITISLPPAPVISSPLTATAFTTSVFSYTLTATNNPTSYAATDLPAWLSFNSTSHVLSGQPPALGTVSVTISATNVGGTTSKTLVITVSSDPIGAALDGLGLAYTRGGSTLWFSETTTTHDGVDALQAGDINDSQENWVETSVTGPDRISFWWKVDSEGGWDYLNLNVDGVTKQSISGAVDWAQVFYDIPAGTHLVRWVYRKDSVVSSGADTGWIDEVRLASQTPEPLIISPLNVTAYQTEAFTYQVEATKSPTSYTATGLPAGLTFNASTAVISGTPTAAVGAYNVSLTATGPTGVGTAVLIIQITTSDAAMITALDGPGVSYVRTGASLWYSQAATTHDGTDAARSGPIGPSQETTMSVNVTGPDRLSFWWKVSCSQYNAYLEYSVDGSTYQSITGEQDWAKVVYDFPAGQHTLSWRYYRYSGTTVAGSNAGFVDQVTLASQTVQPTILSPISSVGYIGTPFSYQITATKDPTSFTAAPLPFGMTLDPATGVISGTAIGEFSGNVLLSATGPTGTGTGSLFLVISTSEAAMSAAMDSTYLSYTRNGRLVWRSQNITTHDGVDAAEAPKLNAEEYSTLSTSFTTTKPEIFSFWWKCTVPSGGYLEIYVDGSYKTYISGTTAWTKMQYNVGTGDHTVQWYFYKYNSASGATESAWVDEFKLSSHDQFITSANTAKVIVDQPFAYQVVASQNPAAFSATGLPAGYSISPSGLISGTAGSPGASSMNVTAVSSLGSATDTLSIIAAPTPANLAIGGDAENVKWDHGNPSDAFWHTQYSVTHDGVDALQSGGIGHSQTSSFETTVQGPGTFTYWWKVSSQSGSDYLRFYMDGSQYASISGEQDWVQGTRAISSGTHVLKFAYVKGSSSISGADAGYVDQINFAMTDADSNGVPDGLQNTFPGGAASLPLDLDGDGMTTAEELAAGTSPTDAASVLRVTKAIRNANGSCHLEWDAIPGRSYALEYSTDLATWKTHPARFMNTGTKVLADVQPATATTSAATFVEGNAPCKAIAPSSDIGTNWRGGNEAAFAAAGGDSTWTSGTQGVGYENDSTPSSTNVPYTPYIGLNLKTAMFNSKATAYIRIPFNVANAALVKTLNLQMRYDDGYAAFINGVQIASDLSPSTLSYNATSSGNTVDSSAAVYRPYDVTASAGLLKTGQNILAIHIMNGSTGSSDLLSQAILSGTVYSASPTPAKIYWRIRTQ